MESLEVHLVIWISISDSVIRDSRNLELWISENHLRGRPSASPGRGSGGCGLVVHEVLLVHLVSILAQPFLGEGRASFWESRSRLRSRLSTRFRSSSGALFFGCCHSSMGEMHYYICLLLMKLQFHVKVNF